MIARLKTVHGRPEDIAAGRRFFEDVALPCAREQAGFRAGWFLADPASGRTMTLTLWDEESSWLAARGCLRRRLEADPRLAAELRRINAAGVEFTGYDVAAGAGGDV